MLKILAKGGAPDEANAFLESRADVNDFAREMASELFSLYRPYEKDALAENIQYVTHFHTKFYHMENGEEKTIPYATLLDVIRKAGYQGYLISEYEGHYCYDSSEYPAADQVLAHIAMERRLLNQ